MEKQLTVDDTYLSLATANVLRLRRQFELAETMCSEILRRDPKNAAAHSILGDVARDRGKLKDAIEWYKITLDLDPGSISDRRKLEVVIDRAYPREKLGPIGKLRDNVTDQIMASSAEIRAAHLPLAVYVALGIMLTVIVGVTVMVLALGQRAGPTMTPVPVSAQSGAFVAALEPQQTANAATEVVAEPRFTEDVSALEVALLDRLRQEARVVDPNCQVLDSEIDPRDGEVMVRISMPRVWSSEDTRHSILRVAAQVARAAVSWDERVSSVRVRCDVRQRGLPQMRAFVGEADMSKLASVPAEPGEQEADQAFSSFWWEPCLMESRPLVASPSPPAGVIR